MNKVLIVDYSLGNLRSVYNAINLIKGNPKIATNPDELKDASHVILPGVGSFGDGIARLNELGWVDAIKHHIQSGKPFLGICLGMQLLATKGNEHGQHEGLDIIKGTVDRLMTNDSSLRIPHVGWNDVAFCDDDRLSQGLNEHEDFYFVHSYVYSPSDESFVSGKCDYGVSFAAVLEHENVFATQFHPEKSQKAGLVLLKNFVEIE